jgi:hypothetical protein
MVRGIKEGSPSGCPFCLPAIGQLIARSAELSNRTTLRFLLGAFLRLPIANSQLYRPPSFSTGVVIARPARLLPFRQFDDSRREKKQ